MRFAVVNLGCKVNRVESDAVAARLAALGCAEAREQEADLIVVNTCAVTGEAEKKTRKAVRHALRANDAARVLVTGCAAALRPEAFTEMSPRVECVGKAQLEERAAALAAAIAAQATERAEACPDAAPAAEGAAPAAVCASQPDSASASASAADPAASTLSAVSTASIPAPAPAALGLLRVGGSFPTRVGVKVQDGCNNACTYCIVHVARGRATSRPADAVAAECAAYARAGVKEIVLTGINLGSYRCEEPGAARPVRLAELLRRLLAATADAADGQPCRFRISSIEPRDVDDDLIALLAEADGRVCRHLHLPLQAGSAKVLREMARPYDPALFVGLVDRLRAAAPTLALSTDIIAGFPGETDAEFEETLALARRCGFAKIHAFPYSPREGTPAAARADQVPADEKERRAARLRALGDELRADDYRRRAGRVEQVLVERAGAGMTESYYEVAVAHGAQPGALVSLTLPEAPLR